MPLHPTVTDLAMALVPVTSLLALWLRLSWRTRQERARRGTLVDLAQTLPPGSELEETAADGTHLRITLTPSTPADPGYRASGRRDDR
ncbi:MAG TPA: hypothetical protein VFP72_22490 [Kineosporiaceae bacterium]|nr:hypothetical protein [Kineosporiaceae bacterium]